MKQTYNPISYRHDRNNRKDKIAISIYSFIAGAIIGGVSSVYLFINITGASAEPSQPISAPTLSVQIEPSTVVENEVVVELTAVPSDVVENTQASLSPIVYRIIGEESEARFSVYETFPEGTAIGRTNQIAGDILIDFNNPVNSQLGTIRINLRTLATDDPERDNSIRCCVLLTSRPEYEFADFVPIQILGLPEQVEIGQVVSFQVVGNLTLKGVTNSVTFDVIISKLSLEEINGTATGTVNRSDFGILNSSENGFDYHGVVENVELAFTFVARAQP